MTGATAAQNELKQADLTLVAHLSQLQDSEVGFLVLDTAYLSKEFLARLAVLDPAPRVNIIRFHGQLAPCAKWRGAIVLQSPDEEDVSEECDCADSCGKTKRPRRNYSWAFLMA